MGSFAHDTFHQYTTVKRVLMVVPAELHLQIVCCFMQGIMDMSPNLDRWNRGGWVHQDGSSIPGVSVVQQIFELLTCREHQVQWKVVHAMQPHKRHVELVEVFTVGVRLVQTPPALSAGGGPNARTDGSKVGTPATTFAGRASHAAIVASIVTLFKCTNMDTGVQTRVVHILQGKNVVFRCVTGVVAVLER